MRIVSAAERPDLDARADALTAQVWPEYNTHGAVMNEHWPRLDAEFRELQFVLFDEATDEVLAQGHTIPVRWDGTLEGLPAGIDAAIAGGSRDGATALCA